MLLQEGGEIILVKGHLKKKNKHVTAKSFIKQTSAIYC